MSSHEYWDEAGTSDLSVMRAEMCPDRICEYDGTPLPVTRDGRGDACPVCKADLDRGDSVETESEVQIDQTS